MKEGVKRDKKGQVTIFIILAIVIVGLVAAFYAFYPEIRSALTNKIETPQSFLESCLEEDLGNIVETISANGGYYEPEFTYNYRGQEIAYLCYTNEYYKTCTVQQPMLISHVSKEIKNNIQEKANECLDELERNYKADGYKVSLEKEDISIELLPKRIGVVYNSELTLTKEGSDTYDGFTVMFNNNLYELLSITNNIIGFESSFGDAETTMYMDFYRDLKVEKLKQEEGTKVYRLTDLNNENAFQFATRSVAWPPGYSNEN